MTPVKKPKKINFPKLKAAVQRNKQEARENFIMTSPLENR
jgi:hypothetical protein